MSIARHLSAVALLSVLSLSSAPAGAAAPNYKAIKAMRSGSDQLDALMKEPYLTDLLAYTKKEFNSENIQFMLDVKGGKDKKAIYNRYIAPTGAKPINISGKNRAPLAANAAPNKWERMDFGPAVAEIHLMVTRDVVPRFLASK
jgi:hypothetical protein